MAKLGLADLIVDAGSVQSKVKGEKFVSAAKPAVFSCCATWIVTHVRGTNTQTGLRVFNLRRER